MILIAESFNTRQFGTVFEVWYGAYIYNLAEQSEKKKIVRIKMSDLYEAMDEWLKEFKIQRWKQRIRKNFQKIIQIEFSGLDFCTLEERKAQHPHQNSVKQLIYRYGLNWFR